MASLRKNVASQNVTFGLINASTGAALTGATVGVHVTKDNGTQGSGGGTVTEAGNGQYNYAPTQAETNAVDVGFLFTATSAIPVNMDFHTDDFTIVADAILDRDMSAGTDSGSTTVRTPRQAFRALRNKVDLSSGTSVTVYKEDDATSSWTAVLTTNGSAAPIVTVDPAGP